MDGEVRRIADLVAADDDGTDGAERVERLATGPLPVAELEVARGDVVEAGVAEDVRERVLGADLTRGGADDHAELGLVVDLGRQRGVPSDVVARADDRGRELGEDEWRRWRLRAGLRGVVAVVPPDRDNLARPRDRGEEAELGEWCSLATDPGRVNASQPVDGGRAAGQQLRHRSRAGVDDGGRQKRTLVGDHREPFAVAAVHVRAEPQGVLRPPFRSACWLPDEVLNGTLGSSASSIAREAA